MTLATPPTPLTGPTPSYGPRANAARPLKTWHILRKLRCCPWLAGKLARATTCPARNYDVIRYDGSRSSVLVSQRARPGLLVRGTVNVAISAVIFTMPNRSGRVSVWRWSGGTPFKIPAPGGQATDPVW